MTEALIVSNLLLWLLVVLLAAVVVALTRQIGVLHERIAPAGALAVERGPKVGEAAPELTLAALDGSELQLAAERTLLFFLSPTCPVCKTLLPTLRRIADEEGDLRIVYASDGRRDEHTGFVQAHGLPAAAYVLSEDLGLRFEVSKLPYAVLIDADRTVRAKGLVNTREHLESLFEAERLRVGSLQEYARQQTQLEVVSGGASR